MAIHTKMFDTENRETTTMHRVYVEFEGGYFSVLGMLDNAFQEMVEELGRPVKVEFRSTSEGWFEDDMGDNGDEGGTDDHR